MYAYIRGTVAEKGIGRAVIEASGVGYELNCSDTTLKAINPGEEAKLLTHFHLSQDAVALYGFATPAEREMFRRLIAVNRVGPKLALSILGKLSVNDIITAILTENSAAFDRIPGLGKKTAARLLLELKEKVAGEDMGPAMAFAAGDSGAMDIRTEAVAALVALGYDGVSAGRAVAAVGDCPRVEDMITAALRELGKRSGL